MACAYAEAEVKLRLDGRLLHMRASLFFSSLYSGNYDNEEFNPF
jgi:hypothetical protein